MLRIQAWRETLEAAGLEAEDELLVTESYGVAPAPGRWRGCCRCPSLRRPCSPTRTSWPSPRSPTPARRLRVPEDLSVLGVDGHPLGELLGVTTVDQDVARQGRLAAELAVRLVAGEDGVSDVRVPTRLVDRGSTSVLNASVG